MEEQRYTLETAWPGWIMSILGATLVLWTIVALSGNRVRR